MVLDSHTHAWGPPSERHPWVNATIVDYVDDFDVATVYEADRLLADMDRVRVDEAVLVGYPICDWTDNWYTVAAVEEHDRLYGVVMLDQFAEDAAEELRDLMAVDGILGFRLGVSSHYDHMWEAHTAREGPTWLLDAIEREPFWRAAGETDALVQVSVGPSEFDQARRLVERYPDLTYLFDAFGPLDADASDERREALAALADHGTVGVKASHAPYVSNERFPYEDVHELVSWLVDTFGRERVAWGSDFPNVSRHDDTTYPEAYNWLYHVQDLSTPDRRWLEGRAFRTHVGL